MADTSHISINLQNKSSDENTDQIDNICFQCGQDHSYKLKAGNTILDMIPFLNIYRSREV